MDPMDTAHSGHRGTPPARRSRVRFVYRAGGRGPRLLGTAARTSGHGAGTYRVHGLGDVDPADVAPWQLLGTHPQARQPCVRCVHWAGGLGPRQVGTLLALGTPTACPGTQPTWCPSHLSWDPVHLVPPAAYPGTQPTWCPGTRATWRGCTRKWLWGGNLGQKFPPHPTPLPLLLGAPGLLSRDPACLVPLATCPRAQPALCPGTWAAWRGGTLKQPWGGNLQQKFPPHPVATCPGTWATWRWRP